MIGVGRVGSVGGSWWRAPAAVVSNPPISVNPDAFTFTWTDGTPPTFDPEGNPLGITVQGPGHNSAGEQITYTRQLIATQRLRTSWVSGSPNTQLTANQGAMSDHAYMGEVLPGCPNNSTVVCPVPIGQWGRLARTTVYGNQPIVASVNLAHRDARDGLEVACVEFLATDSAGNTSFQRLSVPVVGGLPFDRHAVEEYVTAIPTTGLVPGYIKVDCKIKAWLGGTASVQDTATNGRRWENFSTRWYYKRATEVVCYVSGTASYTSGADNVPAGNNATGLWTDDIAAAKAAPFATVRGAKDAITAARNSAKTLGICDGLRMRLGGTAGREHVLQGGAGGAIQQIAGALVIERDPEIGINDAVATFGASGYPPAIALASAPAGVTRAAIIFEAGLRIRRTGTGTIATTGGANLDILLNSPRYDRNGLSTALGAAPAVNVYVQGLDLYDGASPSDAFVSMGAAVLMRGVDMNLANGLTPQLHAMMGCIWKNANGNTAAQSNILEGSDLHNVVVDAVEFRNETIEATYIGIGATGNLFGFKMKHVFGIDLRSDAGSSVAVGISRDAQTGNTSHVCIRNSLILGAYAQARCQGAYNDAKPAGNEFRTHLLWSIRGFMPSEWNIKNDLFAQQPYEVKGNWSVMYGAGCYGNWMMYSSASQDGTLNGFKIYSQQFAGRFSYYPAAFHSLTAQIVDPGFVDFRAVTSSGDPNTPTYTAGTPGGDYRIGPSGAARGRLPAAFACRRFDIAGLPVTGNDTPSPWR